MQLETKNIKLNSVLNRFEFNRGKKFLKSVPTTIGIGTHFFCNANCIFCLGGNYPYFTVDRYETFFEERLADVLYRTSCVDFHGYGELLLMPKINEFLNYLDKTLPNQIKTFFTNGVALKNIKFPTNSFYNVIVSLHASNKQLHKQIVGVDSFDDIISNIKKLQKQKNVRLSLYSVLTNLNLNDMENFLLLANKLKIKSVVFRYLTIFEYKHFNLSVFFNRKVVNDKFKKIFDLSINLGINVNLPHSFKKYSTITQHCCSPWDYFYVENHGNVNKCIFADTHIGNLNKSSFDKIWNNKKYQILRENLFSNKPDNVCKKCINYNKNNVNKLSSHITFRPKTYNKMLKYVVDNKEKYKLKLEDII